MKITVCYDIVSDRRRCRVVKILLGYGYRVQKSVFECILSKNDYAVLRRRLNEEIDPGEDSIRYYFLCADCDRKIELQGVGMLIEETKYIII